MRRIFILMTLLLLATIGGQAQTIATGNKWFDGSILYKTKVEGTKVTLMGTTGVEGGYMLYLEKTGNKPGEYVLDNRNQPEALSMVNAKPGWRVNYVRQEGMYFLAIRNPAGDAVWVATLTPDNLKDCRAQQADSRTKPVSFLLQNWLMNSDYLSQFSKKKLRLMRNEILARHGYRFQSADLNEYFSKQDWYKPGNNNANIKLSIIEQTNLQLIKSEEAIPDAQRTYVIEDDADGGPIYVNNAMSFLKALGNNRTIIVEESSYINLSDVLNDEDECRKAGIKFASYGLNEVAKNTKGIFSEDESDGRQLTIMGLHDLTIRGERNTQIVVEPRYSFVFSFINCEKISISNLTLGHTNEGYCEGGVIGLEKTNQFNITSCDLYGCGTYGIVANECNGLTMENSIIRDCSYGIMELRGADLVTFNRCDFYRNREYGLVFVDAECSFVTFSDCRFAQNKGLLFATNITVKMEDCEVHHQGETGQTESELDCINTEWENDDNELEHRAIGPDANI